MKKRITELCCYIALTEGVRCNAYFSDVKTTGVKVTIEYRHDIYTFRTYREALKFLQW